MKHHQLTEATVTAFHELTKVEIIVWCYCKASDPFGTNPTPGPAAIARQVNLDKGGISKALKSLKAKGWSVDARQQPVDERQHGVDARQQIVDVHQPNVDAGQRIVDARQLSNAETLSLTGLQDSLDLEDLKKEDPERRERDAGGEVGPIRADEPAPILKAIAQVESSSLDPQRGLTAARPRRVKVQGFTTVGEGQIPADDWPKVREFAIAKARKLPNPPASDFALAMKWLRDDPEGWHEQYLKAQSPPSVATEILARATGTRANPWPEPEPQPRAEPTTAAHVARLAAKWRSLPGQRKAIAAECERLNITCTELGPTSALSA